MAGDQQLRAFIERILRLKEEQDTLAADIREVYAEAKATGFDKTAMGQLVAHLRKVEKVGVAAVEEGQSVFDTYLDAYRSATGASHTYAPARAREIIEQFDVETGEITEHEQPETPANEIHERPSNNDKAYPEAGPQAEASLAGTGSGMLADREGRSEGEAASADLPAHSNPPAQPSQALADSPASTSSPEQGTPFEPPAFLVKERKPLRPNCLHPDLCASGTRDHCWSCKKAMATSEAEVA